MPITPPKDFAKQIEQQVLEIIERKREAIIYKLGHIGNQVVNMVRQQHKYQDQTGNLTSSVGYVIVVNGEVVQESAFEAILPTAKEGSEAGRSFAHSLANQYPQGITLIVVAGMNYAVYVEAKNLGGMIAGEIKAKDLVQSFLQRLNEADSTQSTE